MSTVCGTVLYIYSLEFFVDFWLYGERRPSVEVVANTLRCWNSCPSSIAFRRPDGNDDGLCSIPFTYLFDISYRHTLSAETEILS